VVNNAKEVLGALHTFLNERCLIAFPTADNIKDTCPLGFSNDQLYVLKTYPRLDSSQPRITITDETQNDILIQNLNSAQKHINMMEDRAKNGYLHILVTGDINSGKSAFINGLLRRKILPSGGKSLTSTFVEVLDAQDLDGREEAHLCRKDMDYDCKNEHTFVREDVTKLRSIIRDWHDMQYDTMYDNIRVYVNYHYIHNNFFSINEHGAHIIDSVGLNTGTDATRSLFEKQQEIDVLIFIIDARYGLTESSTNMMRRYCEDRTQLFIVITHLDCVCDCEDKCSESCEEVCKQKIMDAIKKISPETYESTKKLIHCVNPTLVPIWDAKSDNVMEEIPSEWTNMETCLHTFINNQFDFHKLCPIKIYLKKVMHDVILISQLNEAMVASKIDETIRKIHQIQDCIGQLEDKHDKAYIEAKNKIDETKSDIRDYILRRMNDLKENPENLISKEMIKGVNPKNSEAELQKLIEERWKEIEKEIDQKIEEYIQDCRNYILIKSMLQDVDFDVFGIRNPEKSLKFKMKEIVQQVLSSLDEVSMQTWMNIMYQNCIDMISKYSRKSLEWIRGRSDKTDMSSNEKQGTE
jgi:mitofusin